jgi:hypothetical protein
MLVRVIYMASIVMGLCHPAVAQVRRGPAPKPKMERFAAEGQVLNFGRDQILMRTNTNQNWLIYIDPKAKIRVVGAAEADFLSRGHSIRFTAVMDERGQIKEKVDKLTLFTPSQPTDWGFWPEETEPQEGEGAENGPGGGKVGPNPAHPAGVYMIAGRIEGIRKGKLTINARLARFLIELAEKPKIKVDLADLRVMQRGDKISVIRGQMPVGQVPPGRMGRAKATELRIELAQPLTGPRKSPKRSKPAPREQPSRGP